VNSSGIGQMQHQEQKNEVELFFPDSDTEPRHWVRHDQAFAMMLGPGSLSGARSDPRWKSSPTQRAI